MNSLPIPPTPRIPSVNAIPEEDEQLEGRWTPRLEADDGGEDDGGDGAIFYYEEKIIGFLSLEIIIFIGRESKKYETKKIQETDRRSTKNITTITTTTTPKNNAERRILLREERGSATRASERYDQAMRGATRFERFHNLISLLLDFFLDEDDGVCFRYNRCNSCLLSLHLSRVSPRLCILLSSLALSAVAYLGRVD